MENEKDAGHGEQAVTVLKQRQSGQSVLELLSSLVNHWVQVLCEYLPHAGV